MSTHLVTGVTTTRQQGGGRTQGERDRQNGEQIQRRWRTKRHGENEMLGDGALSLF